MAIGHLLTENNSIDFTSENDVVISLSSLVSIKETTKLNLHFKNPFQVATKS